MERDTFFQKLRGIAIIMVVLIHTVPVEPDFFVIIRQIFNIAVPTFFFLSGYFIKEKNVLENGMGFVKKRLVRILIPYLFWSITALFIIQFRHGFDIGDSVIRLLTGRALVPYYFIIVMVQMIVITPIMVRLHKYKLGRIALFSITPISLIILYYANFILESPLSNPGIMFPMWFILYYYGYILGNNKNLENRISKNISINLIAFSVLLAISILEGYLIYKNYGQARFATSQIKISTFLMSMAFINFAFSIKSKISDKLKGLSAIGDMSFGIFLIHMIVIKVALQFADIIDFGSFTPIILFACGLFGSMGVIYITKKIFGDKISKMLFGF